jgi:hypothetical protein
MAIEPVRRMPELKPTRRFKARVRLSATIVLRNVVYVGLMRVLIVAEQQLRHVHM